MVQINFGQREVSCKVVFYGPGMSGKTTNLEIIHKKAPKDAVGEMVSIATETDRTLYFDFLPLDLGQVAGMRTKFALYTVPGQIYYNATRKLVLQSVDGVIFVADSNPDKMSENLESLQNLRDNLNEMGLTIDDQSSQGFVPVVLQYNKRDLPNALPVADIDAQINPMKAPTFEACARDGKGVFATLKEISRLVIEKLNREHAPAANRRRTATSMTPVGQSALPLPSGAPPSPPPSTTTGSRPSVMAVAPQSGGTPAGGQPTVANTPRPPPAAIRPPPPRPAPPPPTASPTMTPNRPMPVTSPTPSRAMPSPPPPRPYQPPVPAATPAPTPADELSPREKHLSKPKPPTITSAAKAPTPDLGHTEPNLKRYQQQSNGGGALKTLAMISLVLIAILVVFTILIIFVPFVRKAVRPIFPPGIQRMLMDENEKSAALPRADRVPVAIVLTRAGDDGVGHGQ